MKNRLLIILSIFSVFTLLIHPAFAIGEIDDTEPIIPILANEPSTVDVIGEILRFGGQFESDDDEILVQFVDLRAGDTIYAYAAGVGRVDTYMYVLNETLTDVFVEDNDSGGGYNAALSYQVQEDGTYMIGLITRKTIGRFQLVVGVNTPEIISVIDQVTTSDVAANLAPFTCDDAIFGDRPALSGEALTFEADHFVIHYTNTGSDAASEEWIAEMAIALQLSLDVQLNDLGWALPPSDCGEGGDTRLDVYVTDIDFALGIASPENVVGDNPKTDGVEFYAAYSYLVIENDIDFVADRERAFNMMRTTAAHEVHHNIQFGYDVNDRFFGFYEAGATWIETLVYPELTNAGSDVAPVFNAPDRCIGAFRGRGTGDGRVYGEWVLIDSFTRDLGFESYQFIWEYMAENEGLEGFYRALEVLNTTPQEVVGRMAVRNLLHDYAISDNFQNRVRVERSINGTGSISPRRDGIQELGVDYVRIRQQGIYNLAFTEGDNLAMWVVGIEDDIATVTDLGTGGTVDTTQYDYAYVIVRNMMQHSDWNDCSYTDWELLVSEGNPADVTDNTGEIWNASKFGFAD